MLQFVKNKKIILSTLIFSLMLIISLTVIDIQAGTFSLEKIFRTINSKFKETINVGFDVDNTLLFTEGCTYPYIEKNCNGSLKECLKTKEFHEFANCKGLRCAITMPEAKELIKFHEDRGDNIIFITARKKTENECLTNILSRKFKIKNIKNRFIFNDGSTNKIKAIRDQNISIFYGDSDDDISSALEADAMPIRIKRPDISRTINDEKYNPGKYREIVLDR